MEIGIGLSLTGQAGGTSTPALPDLTLRFVTTDADTVIGVPMTIDGGVDKNINVDWGDGSDDDYTTTGFQTHTIATPGEYLVTVTGDITALYSAGAYTTELAKLIEVVSWGNKPLTRISLYKASSLTTVPTTLPATVTRLDECFKDCTSFNSANVSNWNVSAVTNMTEMFRGSAFNQPLNWTATACTNFQRFIGSNTVFNQRIDFITGVVTDLADFANAATAWTGDGVEDWDTSGVTGMANFALSATAFNGDCSGWDVSSCSNFTNTFNNADSFNRDIGGWDTSAGTNMGGMFRNTATFNQDIGGWDTELVSNMNAMFQNALAFEQDLSGWCVTLIASEPTSWDDGSPLASNAAFQPVWGTCPDPGVPDTTAPTLSSPTDAASGATGGSLSVTTDEGNGTLYWYVSTSATPPSAADLKAGTGAVDSGSQAVSGTGVQNATADGLTASTAYYAHFLHRDTAGNDSSIATADGFTTDAAPSGAPEIEGSGSGASAASNTLFYNVTMPASVQVGEMILVIFGYDGSSNPTVSINTGVSGNNWTLVDQELVTGFVGAAVVWKIAEGSDALRMDCTGSEQYGHIAYRISNAASVQVALEGFATAATNVNPPSLDMGSSADTLWIAAGVMDGDTAIASAAPSGYGNLLTQAASAATGCTLCSADKTSTAQTEDPGTFTTASQERVGITIGVRA